MRDYERVAAVIRYIDEHHREQPDLARLAEVAGLNPYRFHRLFHSWAGITPKDFLQCLTFEHVKSLLRNGDSVLDATIEAGLSSPGRLHDLCVTLEAASPGEMKTGGEGLAITYGFAESPFGLCLIAKTARGICRLSFVDGDREEALARLAADWPAATLLPDAAAARKTAAAVFARPSEERAPLRAYVRGTAFQVRVWRGLLEVESGSLVSYGGLASKVCSRKAARAVGSAVGSNPLAFLIPCHRVIRETGALGGYGGGITRKKAMIAWESALRFSE
jgi:AraC family transcriptional regulator of adaptative response/methylated-DNA-[protein]-cysteine methyltransferase